MPHTTYAALDLGSNSFHLLICRQTEGALMVIDRLRERVQLAAGLDATERLTPESMELALGCLERFGQRLATFHPERVRVVGTSTLRRAINRDDFIARGSQLLGHPIEVVSGHEEARLVYLGVTRTLPDEGRRLVVDIGGGSTESILGTGPVVERADSLSMGCVSWSQRYFEGGKLTAKAFEEAFVAARLELGGLKRFYRELGFGLCHGSSGTINAIQAILTANGWGEHAITPDGLLRLEQTLIAAGKIEGLELPGLTRDRRDVIAGGLAILRAVFRTFRVERMIASKAALREGVVYDLMGRGALEDVREITVERMRERFHADAAQADRVEKLALALFEQLSEPWRLDPKLDADALVVAAQLHEIGKAVSFSGHHRHGAYLVAHADMPGFAQGEQAFVAALLANQRRKLAPARLADYKVSRVEEALQLTVLLRIAVALTRTRSPEPRPDVRARASGPNLHLHFPSGWLDARPLTRADLENEAKAFAGAGVTLTWS
jgi:exopolyphosphatase/guanosine-5'-triphosphate,3'-diphosphate pyrophosphatase